jgi:AcrR family transcriptional regulator
MLREEILEATMAVYKKKGMRFTMDDLAKEMSRSKKTIYTVFRDKKHLFLDEVDFFFDKIKEREQEILCDDSLSVKEKLRGVLSVMPENFSGVDFPSIYTFKDKYPAVYRRIGERLESDWDTTFALIDQGMEDGTFKNVNKEFFRLVYNASIEKFLSSDELTRLKIHYNDALKGLTDMLIEGITA